MMRTEVGDKNMKKQTVDGEDPHLIDLHPRGQTGAEALLRSLKRNGIDYIFSNSGTDFPPIIEAIAQIPPDDRPEALLVPHETAGISMAHGYYLTTGRAQAVMVHVNVGLANTVMGVINAASDNVPVLVMSGRTPITERGHEGSRVTPIQYGQEMFDQSALVREVTKYEYEMRYPEQGDSLPTRAISVARAAPAGPVYLSLPREPLMATVPAGLADATPQAAASLSAPDPAAISLLAGWIASADAPVILCQRSAPDGAAAAALASLCEAHAIAVCEPFSVRNVLPGNHPMLIGHDPKAALQDADLVIVLDSGVPWIEATGRPQDHAKICHIGPDPAFRRMPVRGYRSDLSITADPALALAALSQALPKAGAHVAKRRMHISAQAAARREATDAFAAQGATSPMSGEWLSRCLSEVMDEEAVVFNELGALPAFMRAHGPNRIFSNPHSGGLGWALPAALGAQLADRERLVIACVGDGSYMFANPVACHQIAEALNLPILTIIKNNGLWNAVRRSVVAAYPTGAAALANTMPLTSLAPAPDYGFVARASRAYTERVQNGQDLPAALARAIEVIRKDKRQVVLDVSISVSDRH
jgi:acetolactate synthase-1/2/3 large subunit